MSSDAEGAKDSKNMKVTENTAEKANGESKVESDEVKTGDRAFAISSRQGQLNRGSQSNRSNFQNRGNYSNSFNHSYRGYDGNNFCSSFSSHRGHYKDNHSSNNHQKTCYNCGKRGHYPRNYHFKNQRGAANAIGNEHASNMVRSKSDIVDFVAPAAVRNDGDLLQRNVVIFYLDSGSS